MATFSWSECVLHTLRMSLYITFIIVFWLMFRDMLYISYSWCSETCCTYRTVDVQIHAVHIVQFSLHIIYIQMRNNLFPKTDKIYVLCNITMKITQWQCVQRKLKVTDPWIGIVLVSWCCFISANYHQAIGFPKIKKCM
jgi:hypothetical protein